LLGFIDQSSRGRGRALRHTYATFAIAAGVSLFELARFMGTSVEQIDRTYGHLLPDARERTRAALDAFVTRLGREQAESQARPAL
jgi:integrase